MNSPLVPMYNFVSFHKAYVKKMKVYVVNGHAHIGNILQLPVPNKTYYCLTCKENSRKRLANGT